MGTNDRPQDNSLQGDDVQMVELGPVVQLMRSIDGLVRGERGSKSVRISLYTDSYC